MIIFLTVIETNDSAQKSKNYLKKLTFNRCSVKKSEEINDNIFLNRVVFF